MERSKRLEPHLPNRQKLKTTLTLPVDLIDFLDICARATGHNRSGFLSIILDMFYEEIVSFAKGYSLRIKELREYIQATEDEPAHQKRLIELAENLGVKLYAKKR